jgi:diadenosine tetraphosphate (Ap4A) HIT family hydrolase
MRHVVHLADLNEIESAELGQLLRQTAAAVTEVTKPEQVYTCLWSHAGAVPVHIHFVIQPITRSEMARFNAHGPDLQTAMFRNGELPDPNEVDLICEQLRSIFARGLPATPQDEASGQS